MVARYVLVPLTLSLLLAVACFGAEPIGDSFDVDAVIRRGPSVEHVAAGEGPTFEQSIEHVVSQAIEQTPADDRDKWFVSVIAKPGCPPCAALKAAWASSPELLAIAVPGKPSESWAHLTFFSSSDASQQERWAGIGIAGYPTVIVQAPKSGKFGEHKHVVFQQCGFGFDDSDPGIAAMAARELADGIRHAMRRRIERYAPGLLQAEARQAAIAASVPPCDVPVESASEPVFEQRNNLPPKPAIDGTLDLLPIDPHAPTIPPPIDPEPAQPGPADEPAKTDRVLDRLWDECDGKCRGYLSEYLVGLAALLLPILLRTLLGGGSASPPTSPPATPTWARMLGGLLDSIRKRLPVAPGPPTPPATAP